MSIALTTHKAAAAAVGVAMVFSFAFVTPAQAQTVEDLTAQINSLLATIASLQAQLAGMTGGATTGGTYNFTLNHKMGDQGGEVMDIQKFLNANGFPVASSGAGSPGNETSYFGSRTKAAVMAWQNANAAQVLAPVGLSAGTGYWGPSSRAYANSMGGGTTGGTTVPTGTGLVVAAAAQPANSLAPYNATLVPFTKFTVTNNSGTAQTVNSVTVERAGLAANTNFTGVVLLDESGQQLGIARVLNSNNQANVGEAVTIQPGQTRTFTVAANMEAAATVSAGQIAAFSVIAINTSATVSGSLPITGASHTVNATLAIGTATVARGPLDPGADKTKEVGTTGYTFSSLKVTAGSAEQIRVRSIRWNQSGSAASSDLSNVVVVVDGTEYPTTVSADGKYYTAVFGSGIVIAKGNTKEISIKGNIVGGSSRTVTFDIWEETDIYITGETYGYGIKADDGDTTTGSETEGTYNDEITPAYPAYDVTISAGTVNAFSKSNKVAAGNVAEQVNDTNLGAFELSLTGEGITVTTVKFAIDTTEASGSAVDADDVTLLTLVDQNGTVLAGPVDGSATNYTPTSGTASEGSVSFSAVDFPAGVTTIYVKGKLGSDFDSSDTITIRANPADWTGAKGVTTGNTVSLPSGEVSANVQTVQAASLTVTTLLSPPAQNVVKGATDHIWFKGNLDAANSGEDVRVTALGVKDTTSSGAVPADIDSFEIWANLSGGSTNDSVRGDIYETLIASGDNFSTTTVGGDETLSITLDTVLTIARNTAVEIAGIGDLAGGATGTAGTDTHTLDIDSVTATGANTGSSISITPSGSGQAQTLQTSGTLTISVDSSSPSAALLLDDGTEQTVGVFRLAANNVEDLDVDSIKITDDGDETQGSDDVVSSYVFYNGATKLGQVANSNGTAEIFLNDGTLTVPRNGNVLITVKAVMNDVDGTSVVNGDAVEVTIAAAGDVDTTGKASGVAVDSTGTAYDAATHTVYEAYPTVAFDNSGISTTLVGNANHLLAKIKLTNVGNKDVTFQSGDSNLFSIQVTVVGDDTDTGNEVITLKDYDGTTLDTATINSASGTSQLDFNMSSVGAAVGATIPAGQSRTWTIVGDTTDLEDNGDTIQIWLDDVAADVTFGIDGSGAYTEGDFILKGDVYGPAHVNPS